MKFTIDIAHVRAQLQRELEDVRGFERNIEVLHAQMREYNPFADIEAIARGQQNNHVMARLFLGRASAVLELLGECQDGDVTTGDELEGFIQALEKRTPDRRCARGTGSKRS